VSVRMNGIYVSCIVCVLFYVYLLVVKSTEHFVEI
jgi:hypothetical protein